MNLVITDLQLHSRYARAVSSEMVIPKMAVWGKKKGIKILATGDWTHPLWFKELQANLSEDGSGILSLINDPENTRVKFLLSGEVSCIYSQGGKLRRIHTLIFAPDFETVTKINAELTHRGCNLMSDGRPIIGLTSIQLCEVVFSINPQCLIIPAHCLLPDSLLITAQSRPKPIKDFQEGDLVLTHKGLYQRVEKLLKRNYQGEVLTIRPWYFRPGLTVTPEHPFLAIKTLKKCPSTGDVCLPSKAHLTLCKRKTCLNYSKRWIKAMDLEKSDIILYPRQMTVVKNQTVKINDFLPQLKIDKDYLVPKGKNKIKIGNSIKMTHEFARLIGYYLAEGYSNNRDAIAFCFGKKEEKYVTDVKRLMKEVFGIDFYREYLRKNSQGVEITFYSQIISKWFAKVCYFDNQVKKASTKAIPDFILQEDFRLQAELIRGWYRGDKGYTSSRVLMNQLKTLFIRLGIIPSVIIDKKEEHEKRGNHQFHSREIKANQDCFHFSNLSFFEDKFALKKEIPRSQTKLERRHGWLDENYLYLPIKEIERRNYRGEVFNLEVENDHTYTAEFACVHNCWTPWFSLFGSMSGFDSIAEAFGPYADQVYAVETGLSSDPAMNWRIKELDNRSIVSFSDAHSGPKLGREATIFNLQQLTFNAIREAIMQPSSKKQVLSIKGEKPESLDTKYSLLNTISYSIEFYPEEGKYHFTGHRNCNIRQTPEETKKYGNICPTCGKPLTVGVMHRVEELAGRTEQDLKLKRKEINGTEVQGVYSELFPQRPPYIMLVPLQEIIAEATGAQVNTERVQSEFNKLINSLGSEFEVLISCDIREIASIAGEKIAEGVEKVRKGDIVIEPGYDGVFGVVKIWNEKEETILDESKKQLSLF